MGIQRYSPACVKDSTGDWVEFDDYQALQTALNEKIEQLTELESLLDTKREQIIDLENDRDYWRKIAEQRGERIASLEVARGSETL